MLHADIWQLSNWRGWHNEPGLRRTRTSQSVGNSFVLKRWKNLRVCFGFFGVPAHVGRSWSRSWQRKQSFSPGRPQTITLALQFPRAWFTLTSLPATFICPFFEDKKASNDIISTLISSSPLALCLWWCNPGIEGVCRRGVDDITTVHGKGKMLLWPSDSADSTLCRKLKYFLRFQEAAHRRGTYVCTKNRCTGSQTNAGFTC